MSPVGATAGAAAAATRVAAATTAGVVTGTVVPVALAGVEVRRAPAAAVDPAALALLSPAERARLGRLRRAADRARFATGRAVARRMLGARLGVAPADVPLVLAPTVGAAAAQRPGTGRPVLPGTPLRLSIAHAGDVVLVALTDDGRAVGVDVEGGPDAARVLGPELWDAACAPAERAALAARPAAARDDAFLALWTRKEAVLKATGRGLTVPMTALTVTLGARARVTATAAPLPPADAVALADVDAGTPGYRAAVAVLPAGD
ncbi:4'-phosphopantetheinyl transferase superfamily protein [Patulibacter sp. SYSU D01012]|uniref:4'-phosphopantetheinyl transferase family protein n=1 Tax=Patulibacter sp. SYSU D01012 TaxID=2817381 RepID=UPI001B30AA03|nr:4'-phosphopantetheinyl transferase superfamily protein [Patulibacter sp. SYSU D01012]